MSEVYFLLDGNLRCRACGPGQVRHHIAIHGPVGAKPRAINAPDDVRVIQAALNRFQPLDGGPLHRLHESGMCDAKTLAAIKHFQEKWGLYPADQKLLPRGQPWHVDQVVDIDGPTIRRLRAGPGHPADLLEEFAGHMMRAQQLVTIAQSVLSAASLALTAPSSVLPGGMAHAALAKVERYFKVSAAASPGRRLLALQKILQMMLMALGYVPQGVVLAQDEPPPSAMGAYAFAAAGGYHRRLQNGLGLRRPDGSFLTAITLCPKMHLLRGEMFAYVMVHELAHYVGPMTLPDAIVDHGYFRDGAAKFAALSAEEAFRNADSYAQFVFAANGMPDFIAAG